MTPHDLGYLPCTVVQVTSAQLSSFADPSTPVTPGVVYEVTDLPGNPQYRWTGEAMEQIGNPGTWTFRGLGPKFAEATNGMTRVEETVFGTASAIGASPVAKAIRTLPALAASYNPLQGEFNGASHLGGTGPTVINAELQRYTAGFGAAGSQPACHVMEADGLRLTSNLVAGVFNSYLRGQINTGGGGMNVNAPGGTTATAIADIGIDSPGLASVAVGDVATNGQGGLMFVSARNEGGSTITFEALSGGTRSAYKGNWHITFTKMIFAKVAADIVNGTTTTVTFSSPLPAGVTIGSFVLGLARGANPTSDPTGRDRATLESIASDRLSATFSSALNLNQSITAANSGGLLFVPQLWSGQIWSRRSYGPHRKNKRGQAIRVEITMPSQPSWVGGDNYTKAQMEAAYAAAPGTLWGYWPAVWLYNWRPGTNGVGQLLIAGARNPWAELDVVEVFTRPWHGQNMWSGFLHDQPYTRVRALTGDSAGNISRITGATWKATASVLGRNQTADSDFLVMPSPVTDGTKRSFGLVWTGDQVVHYIDDLPVARSNWSVDTDYPHQLGINVGCGSLALSNCAGLFFPQTSAQATGQWLKIHKIESWDI